jgi:heme ABC exporter ATP-binding subunit CcmA
MVGADGSAGSATHTDFALSRDIAVTPPTGSVCGVSSPGPAVELCAVVALLGTFPALSGVDLSVARGEVVALRGPNGAGKTTVLKVVAGLIPVQRGTITVLGSDVRTDRRSVRRYLGYLGHSTGLYADLSVEQNVKFAAKASGADADIEPALARLGLDGRLRSLQVAHLSAGQRRRVAVASLLARAVPLWLLDEPHAALDPEGRDLLDGIIAEVSTAGTTVMMASHDLDRADRVASRIVSLQGGRIVSEA